ncbi:MAG: tetratricopeptide repeat protein, partial [Phycisphaerales bacterium]
KCFEEFAKQGLPQAQIILGSMYEKGQIEIDDHYFNLEEGYQWYILAGLKGAIINEDDNSLCKRMTPQQIANAQYEIGCIRNRGFTGRIDDKSLINLKEAVRWYTKSAKQGHKEALSELAHIYCKNQYVPQNYEEGFKFLLKYIEMLHDEKNTSIENDTKIDDIPF